MTDFLSSAEVGERLGITARRVQALVKLGKLPAVRHGRNIRFPVRAWEQFLEDETQKAMEGMQEGRHAEAV